MERKPYIIAQEGWKSIAISFAISLVLFVLDFEVLAFVAFCITLLLAYNYRDIEKVINADNSSVVSICDGKVFHIETLDNSLLVSIDTSIFDASIIRTPYDCTIQNIYKTNGINLSPSNIKSKFLNTRASFDFVGDISINVELISDTLCSNINIFDISKIDFQRGDRIALINSGVVKLHLPKDIRLKINIGDNVIAGESIIGFFNKQ